MSALAPTLQSFFTERLTRQRQASPRTVASYRDTLRLLLSFVERETGKAPSALDIEDLNARVISAFLDYLEAERHNTPRTRNARLGAIRSLFRYAALRHPEHAAVIQQVLTIPPRRFDRALVTYLTEQEMTALLAAQTRPPGPGGATTPCSCWPARPGLRATELTQLTIGDVHLRTGPHISCLGKGRKQRITPLTRTTRQSCAPGSPNATASRAGRSSLQPRHVPQPRHPRTTRRQARGHRRTLVPPEFRTVPLARETTVRDPARLLLLWNRQD
jgi:integrase/recombinase XerD